MTLGKRRELRRAFGGALAMVLWAGQLTPLTAQETRGVGRVEVEVKPGSNAAQGRRQVTLYKGSYALLLGNSDYQNNAAWDDLPGVREDLPEVEKALTAQGFKVETALNLTRPAFMARVDKFISDYGTDYENRLVIYYAGHGYTALLSPNRRPMGYLVMKDAPPMPSVEQALTRRPDNLAQFYQAAITMEEIENYAKKIVAKHMLVLFDSCFSGSVLYREGAINVPPYINEEVTEPVRAFLTAGNERQKVADDSPFRKALVRGLSGKADTDGDGYVLSSELAVYVKKEVTEATKNSRGEAQQTPVFGKIRDSELDKGDMVFVMGRKPDDGIRERDRTLVEQDSWELTKDSSDPQEFRDFLKDFPNGKYAPQARIRLEQLVFDAAQQSKDQVQMQAYLNEFPAGVNVTTARRLLKRWGKNVPEPSPTPKSEEIISSTPVGTKPTPAVSQVLAAEKISGMVRNLVKYNDISSFSEGLAVVNTGDYYWTRKWGLIDKTGKEITPLQYDEIGRFSGGLAAVGVGDYSNRKWGLVDKTGKEVIPPKYKYISSFSEGLATVMLDGKYGFIDSTGKEVIPPKFEATYYYYRDYRDMSAFSEGLAWVKLNGKWGLIDKTGKEIIPPKYEDISAFSEGLAWVKLDGKYGLIDKTDKEIIPPKYEDVSSFSEGLARAMQNGKWGLIDKTGKEVSPFKYSSIDPRREGLWRVSSMDTGGSKRGFIDDRGREVIPLGYWGTSSFSEGLAGVMQNGKPGFIDKTGKTVIFANSYLEVMDFKEGLAMISVGKYGNCKYGFIDKTGKEIIPPKYDYISAFSEGLARAMQNGKWGLIDKTGKEVIPIKYENMFAFSEGLAVVQLNGKYGLIDKTEKEIIPPKYEDIYSFSEGLAKVKLNNKYGFIDKTGKEVIPIKYNEVWCVAFLQEGFIGVKLNGKKGFVDIYGNEYFDF